MRDKDQLFLSLIIPAYNEQKIIKNTLRDILNYLKVKKYSWEVVVVDDGSKDNTVKIAEKFSNKGVKLVKMIKNSGKGAALRAGVASSSGKYIIYSDCDLSVPLRYIDTFLKELKKGSDVVIGSRRVVGSQIKVHQPLIRESMGRVFTFLTKTILQTNLADFTCGFKGYEAQKAKKLYQKGHIDRWAYDSEMLFLANKNGYSIYQMPVEWVNRAESRVNLKKVVLESLLDLIKIRVNWTLGKYN